MFEGSLWILRLLRVAIPACLFATPVAARDNFLILIGDDLGVDGIDVYSRDALYGHPGEGANPGPTPNIDQLALEGILFRNAWATPVCSSTRAATLTGRHGFRTGIGRTGGPLDLAETTLPELLAATHANAALGKWHLGQGGQDVDHPVDSGFDYYAGGLGGAVGDYFSWRKTTNSTTTTGSTQNRYSVGPYVDERRAARDGRYKLIWRDGVYEEFFDLDPAEDPFEQSNLLPVSNLSPQELAAYDALVLAMEGRTCALPAAPPVPALQPGSLALLAGLLAGLGGRSLARRPPGGARRTAR
ncbi:MAG: sulfatase-like hydrolase/transferase [Myxococcota bacterium]|nr:sulfatase-like hydrolase/transferase [Myxococcota bacterium]